MTEAIEIMRLLSLALSWAYMAAAGWQYARSSSYGHAAFLMACAIFFRMVGHA